MSDTDDLDAIWAANLLPPNYLVRRRLGRWESLIRYWLRRWQR